MMDTKVILYLAAFSLVAPGAYAAPAPPNGIPQPNQPERRDPQLPKLPAVLPQLAPLAAATALPTTVAVPAVVPTAVNVAVNPLNSVLAGLSTVLKSDLPAAAATAVALPKELVQPVTGALLQDPIKAVQLAVTSLLNALLGGQTSLYGGSLVTPLNGAASGVTDKLAQTLGSLFSGTGQGTAADVAGDDGALKKRQDDGDEGSGSDTGSDTDTSWEWWPNETQLLEESDIEGFSSEDVGTDGEDFGTDNEDTDDNSAPIVIESDDDSMEKRQVVPEPQILVPSAAAVPSGVSDSVAAFGSFAPLADATPLSAVPSSLAALAPDGTPATAIVPAVLVSALADPDNNSLAPIGTVDPLAPLPTELVPESVIAAIAAAASELPTPIKRTIQEIAKSNGLQVRDVAELKQGLDTADDPAAYVAQFIAAQLKPVLNEIGNQMQAAPSVLANIAAAQASNAAAPASIVAAQLSAAQPIIDSIPSIVQSQLEAVPTAALPVFSAASSILDNLENASAGAVNPIAALIPDPTAIASMIADALPVVTATFEAATSEATPTDSAAVVAVSGAVVVSSVASVGQDLGVTPVGPQVAVASATAVPTVYPTVGSPISLQPSSVVQSLLPLIQVFPSRLRVPSTLITQPSSLAQPYTIQVQVFRPSSRQHSPLLQLSSQSVTSSSQQRIPSVQPYPSSAVQSQDTNSATGLVNGGVIMAEIATAVTTTRTTPSSTLQVVPEFSSSTLPVREEDDDNNEVPNNSIADLLTQPLSADGIAQLLENQMYLQLAPLLLMLQSLAPLSSSSSSNVNPLSSSLLHDLLGPSSPSSSSSSSNPASRILDLLLPATSDPSDPPSTSTPTPSTPSSFSSSSSPDAVAVDDPIASAWLAGAKLLQSNSLVNTRLMSPPSAADDDNNNNENENENDKPAAGAVGSSNSINGGSGGGAPAIVANLLNTLLSSSSSTADLTRSLSRKVAALAKWSADTQTEAARVGVDAWEELVGVLVS
ncbi:uncharacterized protein BKCO1_4000134 [Diplodia corticola]|uniref:Uncharacterized protein n=1 Tax=Diplodia corticola TaxID=236234 RepID=A0A1J9RE13_9PEZI|nr:uncharacterized protein BKCO1_4000134 [Diplodia corticola]OJD38649.1 hypothetical protein BKCO1_4000134 [Diplodia corticola]